MVAGTIPIKTPDGQAELATRQRRVSQRHRTVLFLVDGKRAAPEVLQLALQAGVPESCFGELLDMGLIMLPEPTFSLLIETAPPASDTLHVDLPLDGPADEPAAADSLLPASRTLFSTLSTDSTLAPLSNAGDRLPGDAPTPAALHPVVAEVRQLLMRAVRSEAPLAGSVTLLRLRRARSRADLLALLDEVEARITKPQRSLAASHTMQRARHLLSGIAIASREPA